MSNAKGKTIRSCKGRLSFNSHAELLAINAWIIGKWYK